MGVSSGRMLLPGLPSDAFRLGTIVLAEFEPISLWYDASLTIAARALAARLPTDYHVFQHIPDDVVRALYRQGIDVPESQKVGRFRLLDSYSPQTGIVAAAHYRPYQFASQSLLIGEWKKGSLGVLQDPREQGIVHIDENDSLLARYNSERDILDFFQTRAFEAVRKRSFLFLHGFMSGVHSDAFYREMESLADVVLDFKSREVEGHLEQLLRLRAIRGVNVDSRWRLLRMTGTGEVRVLGPARVPETPSAGPRSSGAPEARAESQPPAPLEFGNATAGRVFEALLHAYVQDTRVHRLTEETAGWRSLVQVARTVKVAPSTLYPRAGAVNPVMGELSARGLVEVRILPGAPGRGGQAIRVRIAADREAVRPHLERYRRA